jgi:hypothetical protein
MPDENGSRKPETANVIPFPRAPAAQGGATGVKDLGLSDLARKLGAPKRQGSGHWCSRCRGIWFGYLLEVACPRCGGRSG